MTIARSTGNVLIVATYEILWDVLDHAMARMVRSLGYDAGLPYTGSSLRPSRPGMSTGPF